MVGIIKEELRAVLRAQGNKLIDLGAEGYEGTFRSRGWVIDIKLDVKRRPPEVMQMPAESFYLLADTLMLEHHDNNGPGSIRCPICDASISMKWKEGRQTGNHNDIIHTDICPVGWAKGLEESTVL